MAFDKLKFWKKKEKEEFPSFNLGLNVSKEPGGFSKDTTAGLGGTGELAFKPETDITLRGPGAETLDEAKLTPAPLSGPSYGSFAQPSPRADLMAKDIEIISSKLDAVRSSLESLNQRLAGIEAMLNEQKRRGW